MRTQVVFGTSVLVGLVVWGTIIARYIWPVLRGMPRAEALRPLLLLHAFRYIGLTFLVPGVVSPGWDNTDAIAARTAAAHRGGYSADFDLATYFLHDVPPEIIRQGEAHQRPEAEAVFGEPCRFEAWPQVPIHVIAGRDDRFFPIDFQRRVARERLRVAVDEVAGGHLVALSNPSGLVDRLLAYL